LSSRALLFWAKQTAEMAAPTPLYFAAETAVIGFRFGGPDRLRWFWSFTVTCPMTRSDRVPTLEEAKA
jgi:hypothetical protein